MVNFMSGFLINYNASDEFRNMPPDPHPDPCFSEFTYGNVNNNASFIKNRMSKGDYVFFHATLQEPSYGRYITACFVIDKIMEGSVARNNKKIYKNYDNRHIKDLKRKPGDEIIFGNKEKSIDIRKNPVHFNRQLAEKLTFHSKSDKIIFIEGFSDLERISSSTRQFRELTDSSTKFLWNLCKKKR